MPTRVVVIKAVRDPDAKVWYVASSDLTGLNIEAGSLEELVEKLPDAVADLLDCGSGEDLDGDVLIELIAHASTRVRLAA